MAQEDALANLLSACKKEDEQQIKELIAESGSQILKATSNKDFSDGGCGGGGALHYCAFWGKAKALGILLSTEGVAVDMKDNVDNTALHVASYQGEAEALQALLLNKDMKKLINEKNKNGNTALLLGVIRGHWKVCEALLKEPEIDVQAKDADGWSAIHNAVARGFEDVVEVLLTHRSCPFFVNEATKDEQRLTPLHLAARQGNTIICSMLLKYSSGFDDFLSSEDAFGNNALFWSVWSLNSEAVNFFLEELGDSETNLNHQNNKGETALHRAIKFAEELKDVIIGRWIETPGIKLDLQDRKGETVLHRACRRGLTEIVNKLLTRNKKLAGTADYAGMTPLHAAAGFCHIDTVKRLLELDEPNAVRLVFLRDGDGRTALHWVATASRWVAADDDYAVTQTEDRALGIAKQLLEKAGERKDVLLWASAGPVNGRAIDMVEHLPLLKHYLQDEMTKKNDTAGEDVGLCSRLRLAIRNKFSKSPVDNTQAGVLHKAIEAGDFESAMDFISRGADMNKLSKQDKEEIMKHIVQKKSDQPTMVDSLGRVDLHKAIATLILNPFTGTPITIGILGRWGSGKSSTMLQVEFTILLTIAQSFLMKPKNMDGFPGVKEWNLTKKGKRLQFEILNQMKQKFSSISKVIAGREDEEPTDEAYLRWFFEEGEWQNHYEALKRLALADRTELLTGTDDKETASEVIGEIPAVLTVRFNAWLYETEEEASAGLAVAITRQMEQHMTAAQWLRARFQHACERNRVFIYQKLLIPFILFVVLGGFITWIVLKLLSSNEAKSKTREIYFGSIPVAIIVILWTVFGNIFNAIDPISAQLAGYKISKEHEAKLGHRQMVIDDIRFLKKTLCEKPGRIWKLFGWFCEFFGHVKRYIIWRLFGWLWIFLGQATSHTTEEFRTPKLTPPKDNLRVVVFIDDLDRCKQDSYVLDVLRAINLILAVCEINVVLGVDKQMVEKAIKSEFENNESQKQNDESRDLAEKFLQKIIQLPLDLPEPSEEEMTIFLTENIDANQTALNPKQLKADSSQRKEKQKADSAEQGMPIDKDIEKGKTDCQMDKNASEGQSSSDPEGIGSAGSSSRTKIPQAIEFPMLVAGYNDIERKAFKHLVAGGHNHPRGWKHFLNYYRFASNVVSQSQSTELRKINGWRRQLIVWVFVCWRWKAEMNEIIQDWKGILKQKGEPQKDLKPSLSKIVNEYRSKKHGKEKKEKVGKEEQQEMAKEEEDKMATEEKKLREEKEEKLAKEEEVEEKMAKEEKEKRWKGLCETLTKGYDVSLDGILAFQKFRFHCRAGHLAWDPVWRQVGPEKNN